MLPKINDVLFMQVNSSFDGETGEEFKSRIAEINKQFIAIEIPISVKTGRLKRLQAGDRLSLFFMTQDGVKHLFESEVLGFKQEVIRQVVIRTPDPDDLQQVQRRNFLRVSADLEISVRLSNQYRFLSVTEDVGGGGISFLCPGDISIQLRDMVNCWLLIPYKNGTQGHVAFNGSVVRVKDLQTGKKLIMISFQNITEAERQKVIRYCFERQLELRK